MVNGVVNAAALVIVRLCCSGGLLLLWCCITARNEIIKIFTNWMNLRDVLFGAVFIYGGQFAFMLAIHYSNAGAAAIVLTTVPLWVALWEMIVNRSKPSPRMVICFLLAAVGVTLIVTKGEFDVSQFNLTGLTWAVICAVMTAGYSVQPRQLLKRVAVMPVMGSAMLFGGLMAVVASFSCGVFWHLDGLLPVYDGVAFNLSGHRQYSEFGRTRFGLSAVGFGDGP